MTTLVVLSLARAASAEDPLTIDESGNVGIGTDKPTSRLTIRTPPLEWKEWGFELLSGEIGLGMKAREKGAYFGTTTENPLYFVTHGESTQASKLTIGTDGTVYVPGRVGIGTQSPEQKLHVQGNATVSGSVGIGTPSSRSGLTIRTRPQEFREWGFQLLGGKRGLGMKIGANPDKGAFFGTTTDDPLYFVTNGESTQASKLTIGTDGNVYIPGKLGIATQSPEQKLHVQGNAVVSGKLGIGHPGGKGTPPLYVKAVDMELYNSYVFPRDARTPSEAHWYLVGASKARSYGIATDGWMRAAGYAGSSDLRIKDVAGRSKGAEDLEVLQRIEVVDFRFKDPVQDGAVLSKKVVGQQVEEVYPQAVGRGTDVVPDIYQRASIRDGWVELATDLRVGERVRLIGEGAEGVYEVLEVGPSGFRTGFEPEGDAVFVFGREVDDFRTVDYDAIAMLNVSATQQLKKEVDAMVAEVSRLEAENAALEALVERAMAANAALEGRLAALEARESERQARAVTVASAR